MMSIDMLWGAAPIAVLATTAFLVWFAVLPVFRYFRDPKGKTFLHMLYVDLPVQVF